MRNKWNLEKIVGHLGMLLRNIDDSKVLTADALNRFRKQQKAAKWWQLLLKIRLYLQTQGAIYDLQRMDYWRERLVHAQERLQADDLASVRDVYQELLEKQTSGAYAASVEFLRNLREIRDSLTLMIHNAQNPE